MTTGLTLQDVTVSWGKVGVVSGVTLDVTPGTISLVIGPNGAGKSSLLSGISGALRAAGQICLNGRDITREPRWRRARLGLCHVEQGRPVFGSLRARDNIAVVSRDPDALGRSLELFPELESRLDTPAELLSGGEQQMLVLARALARRPSVILVDEMSLGLAPVIVSRLIDAVRALADGGLAVLLVEQFAQLALGVSDRAYVLSSGRVTYSGDAASLLADPELLHSAYLGGNGGPPADHAPAVPPERQQKDR